MRRPRLLTCQLLALLLSAALALPWAGPAYALRASSESAHAGLEQALQSDLERSGLEEGRLADTVRLEQVPVTTTPGQPDALARLAEAPAVLLTLDAGKGTRFEKSWREAGRPGDPPSKVIAPLGKLPAGWWTKQAAEALGWPVISVVQYRKDDVMAAYNRQTRHGVIYVESENPAGGTGYAFYHGAAVPGLKDRETLLIATAGDQPLFDRPVLEAVERAARTSGADLVIASAIFPDPKNKGRIVRERGTNRVLGILEERDIQSGATLGGYTRDELLTIHEGNVSIYAMPAKRFFALLAETRNHNAQQQFYVTDIVKMVLDAGGRVEAVQIPAEKAPDLTTVQDLDEVAAYMARHPAGLEERGWAQEMVGEFFEPLRGEDLRSRVQVIAPSVVDRYKTLAGFVGRSPFVVIPPTRMTGLRTDEAVADALVRETPAETTRVTFYGRADERRAFVKALARAGRSLESGDVLLKPLSGSPDDLDVLELLPHMMAGIGVSGFEGRWRKFKDALDTLAQQY